VGTVGVRLPGGVGGGDDVIQVVLGLPAQDLSDAGGIADELGRVSRAAGEFLGLQVQSRGGDDLGDHLAYRGPLAGAHVEDVLGHVLTTGQVVQGGDMSAGEVLDVDVVTHAGAVRSRVVGAEDLGGLTLGEPVEHHGDEVEGGHVPQVVPAGAGDVEVAQAGPAQPPGLLGVGHHPLPDELGLAVGVDGAAFDVLVHGLHRGHSVDGGRGGEDHLVDTGRLHGQQHVRQAAHVLLVVPGGTLHGLAHLLAGGEVDDGGDAARAHDLGEGLGGLAAGDVELDHISALDSLRSPVGEVIDDDDLLSALEEKSDHVRADVAGASCNENAHAPSLHTLAQKRTETNVRSTCQ